MTLQQAPAAPEVRPAVASGRTVRLRVFRFKQGDEHAHYDDFSVPFGPRTTVLDCLVSIRNTQDPTLILRHSCFHASCGTCGMRVNDREVLACVTKIADLGADVVKVEPIANQNLVADLVTDMVDFYERFAVTDRPLVRASEYQPGSELPPGIDHYERFESCIECGLCVSACPIVSSDSRYLGPAALAGGWRVVEEPRGRDTRGVLQLLDDPQGSWRCHLAWECTAACPSNVEPAEKIMLLRRAQAANRVRTLFGRGGQ